MKYCKIFLLLLLTMVDVSINAQEVTCEGEQLVNVDILTGHPGKVSPYKPGHILVFRCTDVNMKMFGQRTIECLSSGKWDNPYPTCGEVTCPLNTKVEDKIRFTDIEGYVKPGQKFIFSCNGRGTKFTGQKEITCQSNGEWSSPFPNCEEVMCVANLTENMRSDGHTGPVSIRPGETTTLSCVGMGWKLRGQSKIRCLPNGEWNVPFPKCVREKCGSPPTVNSAEIEDMVKSEYNLGEKVEYKCFKKYTLDLRPPYSRYLTCEEGEWKGNIKCLKPCTVTVEEMDKRGIELRWAGRQKIFSAHEEKITFVCQRGKYLKVNDLRQECNDGVLILPVCG